MKRIYSLVVIIMTTLLILSACTPRIDEKAPNDSNQNLIDDATKLAESTGSVKKSVSEQAGNVAGNTVGSAVSDTIGGEVGKKIGDLVGNATKKEVSGTVNNALPGGNIDIQKIEKEITKITGIDFSNNKPKLIPGIITGTSDGDTVTFIPDGQSHPIKIRILNINSPELKHSDLGIKEEPYGEAAAEFAKKTLLNKNVVVEVSLKSSPYDKYQRLLGYIWIDNKLYESMILNEGLAIMEYVYKPDTKYEDYFKKAQQNAKTKHLNVWSIPGYVTSHGYNLSAIK